MPLKNTRRKVRSIKTLKRALDDIFSYYIRVRDKGQCYTCHVKKDWKQMDAGHYKKRQHYGTRWNEKNVHCQCRGCNSFKGGNMDIYAINLERDYGQGILQELEQLKKEGDNKPLDNLKLEEQVRIYKEKFKQIKPDL